VVIHHQPFIVNLEDGQIKQLEEPISLVNSPFAQGVHPEEPLGA